MTKESAISLAVKRVEETGFTFSLFRRGYKYDIGMTAYGSRNGWKTVEMITPGNVHNFRKIEV